MIPPDRVHPGAVGALYQYLETEIRRALGERGELEERWKFWHRMYRAQPEFKVKEFPFIGSSNIVVPLIATDVDTLFARIMGLLFSPNNLWSMKAYRPDWLDFAARTQEFIQIVQETDLNAYNSTADMVLEMCKVGTGVLKQRYRREHKEVYQFRETPTGVMEQIRQIMIRDHPEQSWVRLEDFLLPAGASGIQEAPWVSERIALTWQQYLNRVREGIYMNSDRIRSWNATFRGGAVLESLMRLEPYVPGLGDKLEFWETWLDFDVSGADRPMALVATLHLPSKSVVRLDYNPWLSQDKPYSAARFLRQEGRFYGIGIGEMLEHFQEEVTAMHNQRIDAGTISNAPMFKGKKNIGLKQDEPVFPGRWFLLDNLEDVVPMQMGDLKFVSNTQYEEVTLSYATRRSGVNDYILGSSSPSVGYAAAHTNIQQFEQAVKRFDQTLREIRNCLSESGTRLVELYQQFNQGGKPFLYMGQQDGAIVQKFLQFPVELVRMGVGVDVTATSATLNKDVEIRKDTVVMQMLTQFYMQLFQAMQIILSPQSPPPLKALAMQMASGGSILMRRILDGYDIQDIDTLIPRLDNVLSGNGQAFNTLGGLAGGGPPPNAGLLPPSGPGPVQTGFGGTPQPMFQGA